MSAVKSTEQSRTMKEWQAQALKMRTMADHSRQSRHELMNRACHEAGIGDYHGCVVHNAMIGYQQGRPWAEVNYSALRRAVRIEATLFEADRIVDRWHARVWSEVAR